MYNLPYFKEHDRNLVLQFMREHPFVLLTGCDEKNRPVATQVPVLLDEREGTLYLSGHLMRNTDHHLAFEKNPNVLAVFTGPHSYVSATWYSHPHQASTWNYMSVYAKGILHFGDEAALEAILKRLTLFYEKENAASTTVFDNLPADYKTPLLKAIISFEIEITEWDNVFKLSQNRDQESYKNIIQQLEQQGGDGKILADEMKKRESKLFK